MKKTVTVDLEEGQAIAIVEKDGYRPHTETAIHRFGEENDGYDEGKDVMYFSMLKAGYMKIVKLIE